MLSHLKKKLFYSGSDPARQATQASNGQDGFEVLDEIEKTRRDLMLACLEVIKNSASDSNQPHARNARQGDNIVRSERVSQPEKTHPFNENAEPFENSTPPEAVGMFEDMAPTAEINLSSDDIPPTPNAEQPTAFNLAEQILAAGRAESTARQKPEVSNQPQSLSNDYSSPISTAKRPPPVPAKTTPVEKTPPQTPRPRPDDVHNHEQVTTSNYPTAQISFNDPFLSDIMTNIVADDIAAHRDHMTRNP